VHFLTNYPIRVTTAGRSLDLEKMIDSNGGLVKIQNVLPADVADKLFNTLSAMSGADWTLTQVTGSRSQWERVSTYPKHLHIGYTLHPCQEKETPLS
jgi:hypothetical protein